MRWARLAAVASVALGAAALCVDLAPSSAAAPALSPPVITEVFTLLPCTHGDSTLAIEGCQEHRVVSLDKTIDKAERVLFTVVKNEWSSFKGEPEAASEEQQNDADLIAAANAWLQFRDEECRAESDVALGGTIQPIIAAACLQKLDQQRLAQLKVQYGKERGHSGAKDPAFPKS